MEREDLDERTQRVLAASFFGALPPDATTTGTRLTNLVELEPLGALGIGASLFPGHLRASIAGNLGILKSILEGGPAAIGGPRS